MKIAAPASDRAIRIPLFLATLVAAVPTAVLFALQSAGPADFFFQNRPLWMMLSLCSIVLAILACYWLYLESLQNNHPGIVSLSIGFALLGLWRLVSLDAPPENLYWFSLSSELWIVCFTSFTVLTIAVGLLRRRIREWMLLHKRLFWLAGSVLFLACVAFTFLVLKSAFHPKDLQGWILQVYVVFMVAISAFVLRLYREKRTSVILCFGLSLYIHGLQTLALMLNSPYSLAWWFGYCLDFGSLFLVAYGILEANRLQDRVRLLGALAERTQELERSNAELHNSESQLRQALKMEAIGRLAGGVAHDFNNLLTVIHGFADLLYHDLESQDPRRGHAERISNAARNASSLTYQLLAFSRKQMLAPVVLSMNMVVRDFTKMLPRLLGEDVDLAVHLAPQDALVRADRSQLEQVIMNLAVNARDAMPKGGKLTIETAAVELDKSYSTQRFSVQPGKYVMLAITDSGTGIDPVAQEKIFEPFFTTKESGKGTGLGLSTVYGIVKQSDGHIWVYSELGKGTTFKIYLPQARELAPEVAPPDSLRNYRGTEAVLLVEDADDVRVFARTCLQQEGYTVLEARNATEAIALAENRGNAIQLLLSDVVMPGFSGLELAEELINTRPQLRVLMMSGYSDEAFGKEAELPKGSSFLAKPFTRDKLLAKVREALDATLVEN
jgi:signal transduction histidine kinase/ActR/RegA family two-component response regulator